MPLNINELWIGDLLRQKSTGRVGKYEGQVGHQLKVNINDKSILIKSIDLELYVDNPKEPIITFDDDIADIKTNKVSDEIDLHIDILAPEMANQRKERILDYQMMKAREYISDAIATKKYRILIIHGKGQGVLKAQVQDLIKDFKKVRYTFDKNDGGATEVWLDI